MTDPTTVADALSAVLAAGTSPRAVGLHVPGGHTITADDICALDRALIWLDEAEGVTPC